MHKGRFSKQFLIDDVFQTLELAPLTYSTMHQ